MRRVLANVLIIAVETTLILAVIATLGVPGGRQTSAEMARGDGAARHAIVLRR